MRAGLVGSTLGAVSAGEQNWYPIDMVGWFTEHVREGVEVTAGQLGLLAPALAEPYRLDDATVARIVRVHLRSGGRSGAVPEPGRPVERDAGAGRGATRRRRRVRGRLII